MKIGIITQGSNGDTEIFVSLALCLAERGHEVELFILTLNNRDYSFLKDTPGLTIYQKHIYSDFKNGHDLEFWRDQDMNIYNKLYDVFVKDLLEYSCRFAKENDVVLGSYHLVELACSAEKFNTPYVSVNYHLEVIRTNYEKPFSLSHIKEADTSRLWDFFERRYNARVKRGLNIIRSIIGLAPVTNVLQELARSRLLNLIPYSKYLYQAKPDWDHTYQLCGYWKSPSDYNNWRPSTELANFIKSGKPPVFITAGSMAEHENNSQLFQSVLLNAAHKINRNVIILTNWNNENCIEGNVYKLKGFVSYPEIFKECCLVVHHGGIGALHHATEAGCPSVIIKYGHDQPYNAKVLYDLGISSGSIHRKDLTAEELSKLINEALENKQMKRKAEELGSLLKTENGVENAARLIEIKMSQVKMYL